MKYFSVGARPPVAQDPAVRALPAYRIVYDAEGDNDSLVSTTSSVWGRHLGVWPADHFHTINKRWVIELKDPTGDIALLGAGSRAGDPRIRARGEGRDSRCEGRHKREIDIRNPKYQIQNKS